jgi:hypothetical protein
MKMSILWQRRQVLSSWIIFILAGRILIYLWQQFPLPAKLERYKAIEKLHSCDLCSGTWIYGILSACTQLSLLKIFGFSYVPVVSEILTGGVISFLVWIFVAGWKEKFQNILVI